MKLCTTTCADLTSTVLGERELAQDSRYPDAVDIKLTRKPTVLDRVESRDSGCFWGEVVTADRCQGCL